MFDNNDFFIDGFGKGIVEVSVLTHSEVPHSEGQEEYQNQQHGHKNNVSFY